MLHLELKSVRRVKRKNTETDIQRGEVVDE